MKRLALAALLFAAATSAAAKNLYIPAAGSAPGANGTHFRTDVRIFNPSATQSIGVSVHFLPQGWDGSNIPGRIVTVGPRQMAVLNDVVGNFLQWPVPAIGAIRLDSDADRSYEFSAESRTYTDSPNANAPGTYGQFIPALDPNVSASTKLIVTHVTSNAAFRTNAGIMSSNLEPTVITATLHRADGTVVATSAPVTIQPMSMILQSLHQLFGLTGDVDDGYLRIESALPLFAFASVVDNESADAVFIPAVKDEVQP